MLIRLRAANLCTIALTAAVCAIASPVFAISWAWMGGQSSPNFAVYGVQGVAHPDNTPGQRFGAATWRDPAGNLWLFGGRGYPGTDTGHCLSDLWKYEVASGNWIWMKGSDLAGQPGVYGERGVAAPQNTPGAREGACSWTDSYGNLWLFGGLGYTALPGTTGSLNDLWKYDVATGNWTWLKGSDSADRYGVYGLQGSGDPANTPGARRDAACWMDHGGRFWLYGGWGFAATTSGSLGDLWRFDPMTGNWAYIKGGNIAFAWPAYGKRGVPYLDNRPGGRDSCVSWTDSSGNLWLFGGVGYTGTAHTPVGRNDLWRYEIATSNWTWMHGSTYVNQTGTYGTQGVAAPANTPGARCLSVGWTDASGDLWLFGGQRSAPEDDDYHQFNDLWKYDVESGRWAWMKGSKTVDQLGTYGTRGVPDPANTPGARQASAVWTDSSGNFWLLGGSGFGASGNDELNDLWMYDVASGNWQWMKGSPTAALFGSYGTMGVASPDNYPGARYGATSWTDHAGNLWLFGGYAYGLRYQGYLNDLWRYDVPTGQWIWMKGSTDPIDYGWYGTPGVPHPDARPAGRADAVSWVDNDGNLWLWGGLGYVSSSGNPIILVDLWKFEVATGNWAFIKGNNFRSRAGVYGTQGVPDPNNLPGARRNSVTWVDNTGNLWLFGGEGHDPEDLRNDLWKFDVTTRNWTWMNGSKAPNEYGSYGTQGEAAPTNNPGARYGAVSWKDTSGNLWLFGGNGFAISGTAGYLKDLWKYDITSGNWTWIKGSSNTNRIGGYGTQGVASPTNTPGSRIDAVSWIDSAGNFWLYGGEGYGSAVDEIGSLSDLWKYDVPSGNWTWMHGSSLRNQLPLHGTQGVPDLTSTPGGRLSAVSWADSSGNFWLFGGYDWSGREQMDLWKFNPAEIPTAAQGWTNFQ